ncbi:transporter substrate-binding domain-containing protein [Pseudoalteromonas sp. SMS1]|uniref:substrate-binding periplasmic protein n=1 Tax=Pseudoalteromonas sp. SMS1 TaxID=2908894 RepID=UPI001F171528|nr:transporter substrate-binding domain-containing protein [Pseudoalteromonas sp. SMS1]MCF2857696.1 transporter substrate-binding domain-containing protein [Pseudoalteromonas sp. SMS1]
MNRILNFILIFCAFGVRSETYTVLVYHGANPPYNFIANDQQSGIFKDLFTRLGELTGHTFRLVPWSVAKGQKLFDEGKIDIEPGVHPSWRVQRSVPGIYTNAYASSTEIVLGKANNAVITDPTQLYGKILGRVRGYRYGEFEHHFGKDKILVYDNISEKELLSQLRYGRVEYVMLGDTTADYYKSTVSAYKTFKEVYKISTLPVYMRLQPNLITLQSQLNSALNTMIKNDEIKAIYARYGASLKH